MSNKEDNSYIVKKVYNKKPDNDKFLVEVEKIAKESEDKRIVVEVYNKYIGKSLIDLCALILLMMFLSMVAISWFTNIIK